MVVEMAAVISSPGLRVCGLDSHPDACGCAVRAPTRRCVQRSSLITMKEQKPWYILDPNGTFRAMCDPSPLWLARRQCLGTRGTMLASAECVQG